MTEASTARRLRVAIVTPGFVVERDEPGMPAIVDLVERIGSRPRLRGHRPAASAGAAGHTAWRAPGSRRSAPGGSGAVRAGARARARRPGGRCASTGAGRSTSSTRCGPTRPARSRPSPDGSSVGRSWSRSSAASSPRSRTSATGRPSGGVGDGRSAISLRGADLVTAGSSTALAAILERRPRATGRAAAPGRRHGRVPTGRSGGGRDGGRRASRTPRPADDPVRRQPRTGQGPRGHAAGLRAPGVRPARPRPRRSSAMAGCAPDLEASIAGTALAGRVRFAGQLPRDEMPARYRSATLLAVTSRHEGQSMVAVEAAASGLPVVGTRVGVLPDLGDGATTVPVGDEAGLADALGGRARRSRPGGPDGRCRTGHRRRPVRPRTDDRRPPRSLRRPGHPRRRARPATVSPCRASATGSGASPYATSSRHRSGRQRSQRAPSARRVRRAGGRWSARTTRRGGRSRPSAPAGPAPAARGRPGPCRRARCGRARRASRSDG